ncbi:MAG: hypothetical protein LBT40_07875 [Deltaproteobacteria bacterium]|jgi:hypothetical protein|nr:hypothetical protein [Deltaproteobacteria bacterium]
MLRGMAFWTRNEDDLGPAAVSPAYVCEQILPRKLNLAIMYHFHGKILKGKGQERVELGVRVESGRSERRDGFGAGLRQAGARGERALGRGEYWMCESFGGRVRAGGGEQGQFHGLAQSEEVPEGQILFPGRYKRI